VAVFDLEADSRRLDFRLMLHSFVTLFWRIEVLEQAVNWLGAHGYTSVQLNAGQWASDADMHRDIATALSFPDYYGRNLAALNDCMGDVIDYQYGTTKDATGLVLAFTSYDTFAGASPRSAHALLDIIARQARCAALTGHRVLCLVQSNDPMITFEPVGAMGVLWNPAEWLDARRRPGTDPHPLVP
jgi:Barstar (barnase inhibitor)